MAAEIRRKWHTTAVLALHVVLAVIFAFVGATKLTGTGNTVEYFTAIGWGQWFRYLTGLLDLAGAALLFVPRCSFYGALMLACSVGLATLISLTVLQSNPDWGGPVMVVVPLAITLLALLAAWLTRPQRVT